MSTLDTIIKRNGAIEAFEPGKITEAIRSCLSAVYDTKEIDYLAEEISNSVLEALKLEVSSGQLRESEISVEIVQDRVEEAFVLAMQTDAARAYMAYRLERQVMRGREVPPEVHAAFMEAKERFGTPIQEFQYFDKYSRYSHKHGRRETFVESVERSVSYLEELACGKLEAEVFDRIRSHMLNMTAFPSMRLFAMAGDAARKQNVSLYNCSAQGVADAYAFVETLLISMAGGGVGYSVEGRFVDKLPSVKESWEPDPESGFWHMDRIYPEEVTPCFEDFYEDEPVFTEDPNTTQHVHIVGDSTEGWLQALCVGLAFWFNGCDTIEFDYSQVRKAGTVLKTKGGTASGPAPLRRMLDFVKKTILARVGRKLRAIDVHDIMTMIGDCAVQGGVRRTAMIACFDFDDQEMLKAKSGDWYKTHTHRSNANNSVVLPDRELTQAEIADLMLTMDMSKSGENGLFSRRNARRMMPERRLMKIGDRIKYILTNPCGEINLVDQFCNLSIMINRPWMTEADRKDAVEVATIIGTIQSMATHFPGLRAKWKKNCEDERLLGVDITGQRDKPITGGELTKLKEHVIETNRIYAEKLGINQATATTCVKPSGNSSVLFDCSPGINPRWSPYQIRRVQISSHGPMRKVLEAAGVPCEPSVYTDGVHVATFLKKAPEGSVTTRDVSAIGQCNLWKTNKLYWTEHNPSCTITYRRDELIPLMQWIYDNQDIIGGMAFLPADESDTIYEQAPNETITKEQYDEIERDFPAIDFSLLYAFEASDTTTSAQEVACMAGACAI